MKPSNVTELFPSDRTDRTDKKTAVDRVWAAWLARQSNPRLCRFTTDRSSMIAARLRLGYTVDDFLVLFRFAWEADEPGPRWWRGDNPDSKRYLDLSNLLVVAKLGARVCAAREWEEKQTQGVEPSIQDTAGPMAKYRRPKLNR